MGTGSINSVSPWPSVVNQGRPSNTYARWWLRPIQHPVKTHFVLAMSLRIEPDFVEAHQGLGRVLTQLGKRDEAIQHYEQALKIIKSRGAAPTPR